MRQGEPINGAPNLSMTLYFAYTVVYTASVSVDALAANARPAIDRWRKQRTIEPVIDRPPRVMASADKASTFDYRFSVSTNNMQTANQSVIVNVSTYPRRCYHRRSTRTESPSAVQQSIDAIRKEKFNGWTYHVPIKLSVPEWASLRRLAASRNMTAGEFIQFHLDSGYTPLRVAIQQFEQKAATA